MKQLLLWVCVLLSACQIVPLDYRPMPPRPTQHAADMTATISFEAPTTYTDGSTIQSDAVLSYLVYQGVRGSAKELVGTITDTSTTIDTGLAPGEICWNVEAVANGGPPSERSNEACKTFQSASPSAVTITVI